MFRDALDRADLDALRGVVVADAFGASRGVDDVDMRALRDGLVRAFGLAYIAVDALVGDGERHKICWGFVGGFATGLGLFDGFKRFGHLWVGELGDVAAERGHFAHQGGRDIGVLLGRGEEHGFDVRV